MESELMPLDSPGQLRCTVEMERVVVQLPGEVWRLSQLISALLVVVWTLAFVVAFYQGIAAAGFIGLALLGMAVFALSRAMPGPVSRVLRRAGPLWGTARALVLLVALLVPLGLALSRWPLLAAGSAGLVAVVGLGMLRRLGRGPVSVVLSQHAVTVHQSGATTETALESIRRVQPGVLGAPVTIDYAFLPGTRELVAVEREWLAETISAHARRRRQALLAEGHDLAEKARPPTGLEALVRRG